jgi:hypothetical protein
VPFGGRARSFRSPLPYLAFKRRQSALNDLAKRDPVAEFFRFVTQTFGFDDVVEAVMGALRNPRV